MNILMPKQYDFFFLYYVISSIHFPCLSSPILFLYLYDILHSVGRKPQKIFKFNIFSSYFLIRERITHEVDRFLSGKQKNHSLHIICDSWDYGIIRMAGNL